MKNLTLPLSVFVEAVRRATERSTPDLTTEVERKI